MSDKKNVVHYIYLRSKRSLTACGLSIDESTFENPQATEEKNKITCRRCKKYIKEGNTFHPSNINEKLQRKSKSFGVSWKGDDTRKGDSWIFYVTTKSMTLEEIEVAMDVFLERLEPWLHEAHSMERIKL